MTDHIARTIAALATATAIAGCNGPNDNIVSLQEVKVTAEPTSDVPAVDGLIVLFKAPRLRMSDGTETVLGGESCKSVPKTDANGNPVGSEVVTTCERSPARFATLIWRHDRAGASPLIRAELVDNYNGGGQLIPIGQYTSLALDVGSEPGVRDSYVILPDQRECELTVRVANDAATIVYPLDLNVAKEEDWHIKLRLDLSMDAIDPAQCATGYTLRVGPAGSEVARWSPP